MSKPRILILIPHFFPGYEFGGPVRTITSLIYSLQDELDFKVVTTDRDVFDNVAYPGIDPGEWRDTEFGKVLYASKSDLTLPGIIRIVRATDYDVLYLNSFFHLTFSIYPLVARNFRLIPQRPVVIAPRGEFSAGALGLKRVKKRIFIAFARLSNVYRSLTWQASSEHEASEIRRILPGIAEKIHVAPNTTGLAISAPQSELDNTYAYRDDRALNVIFLSRISPKKNLDYALSVLTDSRIPIHLRICGPIADQEYWNRCCRMIDSLPPHISASYVGSVPPEQVSQQFAANDVFFFPTRGENFGHVIVESLKAGTPVITSDQTPWQEDGSGCLRAIPLAAREEFLLALEELFHQSGEQRRKTAESARAYAVQKAPSQQARDANLAVFRSAFATMKDNI